jgi:hypothetical protein
VDTVETALGLCGALDEVGFAPRCGTVGRGRSPLRRTARRRAHPSRPPPTRLAPTLAHELLVELMTRLHVEPTAPWHDPRGLDAWLSLVPEEFHARLTSTGCVPCWRAWTAPSAAVTWNARRGAPAGAFALWGLSRGWAARGGGVRRGPRLRRAGSARAGAAGPSTPRARHALELGGGLLCPSRPRRSPRSCCSACAAGDLGAIEDVLDLEVEESLAATAALEAVFRTTGLGLLEGVEIPRSCWRRWPRSSSAGRHPRGRAARPRVTHRVPRGACSETAASGWPRSRSRRGSTGRAPRRSPLDPWRAATPPPGRAALDAIVEELARISRTARSRPTRWWIASLALVVGDPPPPRGRASRWTSSRSGSRPLGRARRARPRAARAGGARRARRAARVAPSRSTARSGALPSRPR